MTGTPQNPPEASARSARAEGRVLRPGTKATSRERLVSAGDIDQFASWTWAVNPIFLSDEAARAKGLPGRVSPGFMLVSLLFGLLYNTGIFDSAIALLEIHSRFVQPVHPGQKIRAHAEAAEVKALKDGRRIVRWRVRLENTTAKRGAWDGELVLIYEA
ncbi:MAG: MaoC family dehydratase [Halobacteria archaeon]